MRQLTSLVLFHAMEQFELITNLIRQSMDIEQIWNILMSCDSNRGYMCPVCGYFGLTEPAYDEQGCSSFEICPCCGSEFGYDDATLSHEHLRENWVKNGALWWSSSVLPPVGWDPIQQLSRANFGKLN